jgi:hypothetical protein
MAHVHIPIAKLVERIGDPFDNRFWSDENCRVNRDMVRDSLLYGTYGEAHWSYSDQAKPEYDFEFTPEWHAQRIAYLLTYGWDRPIEIDVGVPSLGYWPYPLIDGHHRLCAAIYRGDTDIAATVGGSLDYAFELFGVDCTDHDCMCLES